jgi:predicted O-methyltransferase YrrM
VLEIGTFTGYSALCLREGISPAESDGGRAHMEGESGPPPLVTIEKDTRAADIARRYFEAAGANVIYFGAIR